MPVLRLDKMLSDLGLASRREARAMIKAGRVIVNGKQTNACDMKLCTDQDEIILDGSRIFYEQFIYLMLNKPPGYLSAVTDSRSPTVFDLLDEKTKRLKLFPVGRLDKDTEGLLILTNDGEYSHRITAPRHGIYKTYYVRTENPIGPEAPALLKGGLVLSDGTRCLPAELIRLSDESDCSALIKIAEGKYHQVKRMMAKIGCPVRYLKRTSIGSLMLDEQLRPGEYRQMTQEEIAAVFKTGRE